MPIVRQVTPDDLEAFRATRLAALADSPGAFASTLEGEQRLSEEEWRARLGRATTWLAWSDGVAVGLVTVFAEADPPGRWHLVSMWVAPAHRGGPSAAALVDAAVDEVRRMGGQEVVLWVVDPNLRAAAFYRRAGFEPTGRHQPLPSDPTVGEHEMLRRLGPVASDP